MNDNRINFLEDELLKDIIFSEKTIKQQQKTYVADFETCATTKENKEARVWCSGLTDIDNPFTLIHNSNISDFMNNIKNLPYSTTEIFFHNLAFDGSFILPYLLKNNFSVNYVELIEDDNNNVIVDKKASSKIKTNSFDLVVNDGVWYKLVIYWGTYTTTKKVKNKKTGKVKTVKKECVKRTIFKDSLKKVNNSLDNIAKSFHLVDEKFMKGNIDYENIRLEGYKLTDDEKQYIFNDCYILACLIRKLYEEFNFKSLTASSFALKTWKEIKYSGIEKASDRELAFREEFPMPTIEEDRFIRGSYRGGYSYVNPKYKNLKRTIQGKTYDVNSLYPFVMYYRLLPYGKPLPYVGKYKKDVDYPLYVQKIRVRNFELKEGFTPMIQIKNMSNHFKGNEYLTSNKSLQGHYVTDIELTLTNIDLALFLKHYNVIGIKYISGYKFKGKHDIFKEYIEKFMEIKKNEKGAYKEMAKLFLNSLYGKFAMDALKNIPNCYLENDILRVNNLKGNKMFIDEQKVTFKRCDLICNRVKEYNKIKTKKRNIEVLKYELEYLEDYVYIGLATFITAYAREYTLNAITNNLDKFCYADTDSIHLEIGENEEPKNIKIDYEKSGDLGLWKLECYFKDAIYLGQKRYGELEYYNIGDTNFNWSFKCCGLPSFVRDKLKDKKHFTYFDNTEIVGNYKVDEYNRIIYKNKIVKGAFLTKKKKQVINGCLILPTIYKLTDKVFGGRH